MKNKNKKASLFLFAILLMAGFFGIWKNCLASEEALIITEIMYDPEGTDTKHEWLEIFNSGSDPINLENWKFFEASINHGLSLYQGSFILNPEKYAVICDDAATFKNDYGSYGGIIIDSVFSLSNSGESLAIKNGAGDIISECSYSASFGANGNGFSLEKDEYGTWRESHILGGTPGAENSQLPPPVVYSHNIRINELMPDPEGDDEKGEFIELYNFHEEDINLEGWKLKDKSGTEYIFPVVTIEKEEYLEIYYKDSKISLNNSGEEIIYLYDPNGEEVNRASYTDAETENSYAFGGNNYQWSKYPTPGEENIFKKDYPAGVYLNEILPDPEEDEEKNEFIELYNSSDKDINLEDWVLKDNSKTSRYIFSKGAEIESEKYLIIYRQDFDFALNNSRDEKVYLLNPNDEVISSVNYDNTNEGVSYNFDGKSWRWSQDITPGKKNKFNKLPKIEVGIDDEIYIDIYADFKVKVNDPEKEKIKVTWDFGDGHKSYKEDTKHKYEKKGKYKVKVKIFDGSEEVVKEYKIEVKKFPHREVKIRALCPNPAGDDSENEWILVKNYSDDEVNLKGWNMATGSKKLYNHPIYENIEIKKGKTAKITREDSNFTLNNEKSKVELRYPDGKEAYKMKYDKGDDNTAEEDEIYEKTDDGWRWVEAQTNAELTRTNADEIQINTEEIEKENFEEFMNGQSIANDKNNKVNELINYGVKIKLVSYNAGNNPRVLGVSTRNYNEPIYRFTESTPDEHYTVKFFKNLIKAINYLLNKLIGSF